MAAPQLRLLLWKDYLVRKRKLITLGGVIWATTVVLSLYIVRTNVDNIDYKTCQYAARALPSAGVLTFLQSFICSVNNECLPMEQYDQIPTYENSTLTKLQRQFTPLLYNDSVLNVAATVPDALKLLATLADIVDEPTFVSITKHGLKVRDLFNSPVRVRRYIASTFNVTQDVAESIMGSELSFQGIMKGNIDRCSASSLAETLQMENAEHLSLIVEKLCSLTNRDIRKILLDLIVEVNFGKYINMIGDMYKKLSGDERLTQLGYMLTAVLRMTNVNSFLPSELTVCFGNEEFSYIHLTFISKFMDQFKPTFADTQAYKTVRELVDAAIVGIQYLNKFVANKDSNGTVADISSLLLTHVGNKLGGNNDFEAVSKDVNDAVQDFDGNGNDSGFDVFDVLSKLANLIFKWFPDDQKQDILFYSTLLTKLIEGAHKVVSTNMHIEEVAYNASLRNSEGFKLLLEIPAPIVVKGLEALADAERTQIFTSKINLPGQLFCDRLKLQRFFVVSNSDADMLKGKLCNDSWKNYISDLIQSFGFFDVRDNINNMASLLIQKTVGKDTSSQLYTINKDFQVLKDFYNTLTRINAEHKTKVDWRTLLDSTKNGHILEIFQNNTNLRNQILITLHGALAKEIVKQNMILDFKITPVLIDATTMLMALNAQLATTPTDVTDEVKEMYPDVLKTVLLTALDEEKTYRSLSTHSEDILCHGVEKASSFILMPSAVDGHRLVSALCQMSSAIEKGFLGNSSIGKAIEKVKNSKHTALDEVKWTKLINGVKQLYATLDRDYTYLFEFKTFGMDQETQKELEVLLDEAKNFWFGKDNIQRSLHLSLKFGFRVLDLLDREIFNLTSEGWMKVKGSFGMLTGPLAVAEEFIRVIAALSRNESYTSDLPPTTVQVVRRLIPNLPHLIADASLILASDNTDIGPIITAVNADPPWPCSNSLTNLLDLTDSSKQAVEALETVLCLDRSFQREWIEYLNEKNLTNLGIQTWNTTSPSQHIFLKFSSTLDSVIKDTASLKKVLDEIADDSSDITERPVTFVSAWRYAQQTLRGKDVAIRNFFSKLDFVLDSIITPAAHDNVPLNSLWEGYVKCSGATYIEDDCRFLLRSAVKNSLRFLSVLVKNMAEDLRTYFYEINEPDANLLQIMGFTKKTGLYMLYDKMTDFIGVLLNSYWDYGFMNQVRRASQSQFWDCDALVSALTPSPGSAIDAASIRRVQPYICPSLLYWISLPRGDNTLLDVVAKPQYYFFTVNASNLISNFEDAFDKVNNLTTLLKDIASKNVAILSEEDFKLSTMKNKFEANFNSILTYTVNKTDASYKLFNEINTKQFAATAYLARIVAIINKLHTAIESLKVGDIAKELTEDDVKILENDLTTIQKIFKRRPTEAVALHFDLITYVLWQNNDNYTLTNGVTGMCDDLKNNDTQKDILLNMQRTKLLLCTKNFRVVYDAVEDTVTEDYEVTRGSLYNLLDVLQQDVLGNLTDVGEFLKQRTQIINYLKHSINYSYDLGIPVYLKYLHSVLRHQDVILSFISGGNWWKDLRNIYNGQYATRFFENLENSFDIVDDVVTNLDQIHFVRLLRDINVNNTDVLCLPNITLSDYVPDKTGIISDLKNQLCMEEKTELFKELPLLVIASQGYDMDLKISKEINYTSLNIDIANFESKFDLVKTGPQNPLRPDWVTEEKLAHVRVIAMSLLSQESVTKMAFGFLTNTVDAATLFLNTSKCSICSPLTTWFKQLNLQLFKKQEYDNLLCHLHEMSMDDIYQTLKNNFHWDMALRELMSTRNYTKYELNKAVNEFLEHVELHLLEDLSNHSPKLSVCLAKNVTRNAFGNATMFAQVLAHTLKLLRAQLPHIKEIEGISDTPFMKKLLSDVAHNLDVMAPLKMYLNKDNELAKELKTIGGGQIDVNDIEINLRTINQCKELSDCVKIQNIDGDVCENISCSKIIEVINNNLNNTLVVKQLPTLQSAEFWHLFFVTSIVEHVEQLISHLARLLGVASGMDVQALMEGRLAAMLDFVMRLLTDEILDSVVYSLQSIIKELQPILKESSLEADVTFLTNGLRIMQDFKNYFLEKEELRVEVSELFSSPDRLESALSALGFNNTNFWSIAAPRVHAGYINLKPIITPKSDYQIASFVCQTENMSQAIIPANVDVVTLDDVYGAIIEQFCSIEDEQAKQIVPALMENVNFSYVLDKISSILLIQLYSASNLTTNEGTAVLESYPQMAALLPIIQDNVGNLSEVLANEPIFQKLADFTSVGNLFSSSSFLASVGNMLCGTPMQVPDNRFYKAIVETTDFSKEPDPMQLEVLPTDFCRSIYKEVLNMYGGKIVWSYIKPIIMGKILYTPVNPMVEKIIKQANSTYSHMQKLVGLVHSFANAFSSTDKLSQHRDGITVLRRLIASPAFGQLRTTLIGDAAVPDVDVDGLFDEFGDLKNVGSMLRKSSDLLHCINMDRFRPMPNEKELTHEAVRLTRVNEFSAGLVFMNVVEEGGSPLNVEYKIRMDIESVPTTTRLRNQFWTPGPEDSFLENMRYFRGFVQIQDLIDSSIIKLAANSSRSVQNKVQKRDVASRPVEKWAVYTQQTPYPCYRKDYFQSSLYESQALVVAFFFSLLFTVASVVRFIVSDKESGNTMLMSVMGVNLAYHTLSWFVASLVELVVTVACVTLALTASGVLPRTDVTLLFTLLVIYGYSVLMFCYAMSKLFSTASSAAVTVALAYLVTFMPYVLILSLEALLSLSARLCACLSMSTAFSYTLLYIARLEAVGVGAHWSDLWSSQPGDGMSIGLAAIMMLVDGLIYLAIGWTIDRYFGLKTLSSSITHTTTTSEKAGVSIVNVTKIYGEHSRRPKLALDNVSIELHKGQVTTLLGHNGAGKTTLTNILTGMLKPTRGHVTIRSELAGGTRLGVCPQRDVLFPCLSAREHITLYAQLKTGKPLRNVQDEINSMLQVLSLGPHADHPASKLSGGTRRRVCVALAFVGQPDLVSLDEPAAGVDPAARRDIWSMILKLKEDRTVLLTTHHLDEAEFLSDQVVIMHKGQIHTMGSPIEIKRSLGNGYKLTVTYPHDEEWREEDLEEKTKTLLAAVRGVVRNAQVVDADGLEVEIVLPFFDANGLNNDFHKVCTTLESRQPELGFSLFAMDCSSLEQVFFNITSQADAPQADYGTASSSDSGDSPSKSASSSSIKTDRAPLVDGSGALTAGVTSQMRAMLRARWLHYTRNRWLLFLLLVLPSLFVVIAMGFSMIRPPADNEIPLRLHPDLYPDATQFLVPHPAMYSKDMDPSFAQRVLDELRYQKDNTRNWTNQDSPECRCEIRQVCNITERPSLPEMMLLPDADTLNHWLIDSQEIYIEKRYGGYSSALKNNVSHLVAWYNNKGHHALPSFVNGLHAASLRAVAGAQAGLAAYSHPLKISHEQLSKSTLLQHVADAGISGMLLVAYSLVTAGAAVYLVSNRTSQQKRLQLLTGVSPAAYWAAALVWDMAILVVNIIISVCVLEAFGFPVFVARSNLPAICLLLLLFGYSCGSLVHLLEKLFSDPGLANMVIFCANVFLGLSGLTILLIMDIISESQATDDARWVLHKVFMLCPQFILADALLEIAKNTVQAQVLERFGMDTYKDPLSSELLAYHYVASALVGTVLLLLNLAIEYDCFEGILDRFRSKALAVDNSEMEAADVVAERRRVAEAVQAASARVVRLPTIGNINAGFIDTEGKKDSVKRMVSTTADVAQCVALSKQYHALGGPRVAVSQLTLGIPPGQCTALLGENGAGKSTTFAMLTGEVRPTSGQIYLNEAPVSPRQLCSGLISYCPQNDALDPLLTVRETLSFYCELRSIEQEDEVIKRTVAMFDLSKYVEVRTGALSGGNKRKLCAAIAFMGRTPLVLLDEPTSGMDPGSRLCVLRGVRAALGARRGVLLSTHALRDARRLCARVALVRRGALCAQGSVDDCLRRFGGGYAISCRVGRREDATQQSPREAWRRVLASAPRAVPRDLSRGRMHFVIPAVIDDKQEATRLSSIFRLMAELQSECDVEDYTINQSSLEEMFLSFSDKPQDEVFWEPLPSPQPPRRDSGQLDTITSL
ncbi:uncharacterized protein LOC134654508 [Cydia amplana]|uniref:uncharacterized protein LOC134654508 n=1 Tax=Cydia amplana TaxID=1869771 RepID=UPI002FE5FEF4